MKRTSSVFTTERRHLLEIIGGLLEGIILVDMDRRIAWANDTALSLHDVDSLEALGGTAAGYRKAFPLRYRNQRRLVARQYPMDRALAGEAFDDVTVEVSSRLDPDYHRVMQVRGLVLRDTEGEPEGAVLVLLDVTERYSAEERFEKSFNANPAPAVICTLADQRFVKVNQGFLDMTGHTRQDVLAHSVYEVDVLGDAPQRDAALERLQEGRTIPQMETRIALPDGTDKLVVVAGQPIEIGDAACMLFTFNDLESRRKAETALRHSEERFSKAFRLAPVPMALTTPDGAVLEVNDAFIETTGYSLSDLQTDTDALARLSTDPAAYADAISNLEGGMGFRQRDMQLRTRDGAVLDCLISAEPVVILEQRCVLGVIQDITERKRSEAELMTAIEAVMKDTSWFSQTVIEKLAQIRQPPTEAPATAELSDLTPREREILGLICEGMADAEIARTLFLSPHTIRNHVASLYGKLHVNRRSAAIIWARQRGIVGAESTRSPRPKKQ